MVIINREWSDIVATAHIESNYEDIANVVIMPGDPKRARYIAENYLKNYKTILIAEFFLVVLSHELFLP